MLCPLKQEQVSLHLYKDHIDMLSHLNSVLSVTDESDRQESAERSDNSASNEDNCMETRKLLKNFCYM